MRASVDIERFDRSYSDRPAQLVTQLTKKLAGLVFT